MNKNDKETYYEIILYIAIILFFMFLFAFGIYLFIWFLNTKVGG